MLRLHTETTVALNRHEKLQFRTTSTNDLHHNFVPVSNNFQNKQQGLHKSCACFKQPFQALTLPSRLQKTPQSCSYSQNPRTPITYLYQINRPAIKKNLIGCEEFLKKFMQKCITSVFTSSYKYPCGRKFFKISVAATIFPLLTTGYLKYIRTKTTELPKESFCVFKGKISRKPFAAWAQTCHLQYVGLVSLWPEIQIEFVSP